MIGCNRTFVPIAFAIWARGEGDRRGEEDAEQPHPERLHQHRELQPPLRNAHCAERRVFTLARGGRGIERLAGHDGADEQTE
jgi:hypothetical protein